MIRLFFLFTVLCLVLGGCKKFVQVSPPPNLLSSSSVFTDNSTAAAALTGIYEQMMSTDANSIGGPSSMTVLLGLSADELQNYPNSPIVLSQAYTNSLTGTSSFNFWNELYNYIYLADAAIDGLTISSGATVSLKNQFIGEAKFVRAFMHFYLVNIYGNVPIVTSTNYQSNQVIAQSKKSDVYRQIIADLLDAQTLLGTSFVDAGGNPSQEHIRPNAGAATALLARAYLYEGKWDSAQLEATLLINNGLYGLDSLNNVFLANSNEAIWQLEPVVPGYNTFDGYTFILTTGPNTGYNPVYLNTPLLNSFEAGDERYLNWVDSAVFNGTTYYYAYKYKAASGNSPTEYEMVFRLGEQYLIRAEAEAEQSDLSDAANDLNIIRSRAGLPNIAVTVASSQQGLLSAILHERQVELFTEWGHRWMDLNRTGSVDTVLGSPGNICQQKGGNWSTNWALYPLLFTELQRDPNLIQNPGYN
jgi:starch-binding outer membrane protein, SusD/RagB family